MPPSPQVRGHCGLRERECVSVIEDQRFFLDPSTGSAWHLGSQERPGLRVWTDGATDPPFIYYHVFHSPSCLLSDHLPASQPA